MSILQGLEPQAIAEHFGEVDTEYTWLQEPQTMTHSDEVAQLRARIADLERNSVIRTDNGAVIVALEKRIAELERERDTMGAVLAAQSRNAVINGGTPTLTERAQTKRIAELERERDTAKTNALTCLQMMEQAQNECEALRETIGQMEHEANTQHAAALDLQAQRDAAVADARRLLELFRLQSVRSFVAGAAWWEFHETKATMWASDRDKAWEHAAARFPFVHVDHRENDDIVSEYTAMVEKYGGVK